MKTTTTHAEAAAHFLQKLAEAEEACQALAAIEEPMRDRMVLEGRDLRLCSGLKQNRTDYTAADFLAEHKKRLTQ